MLNYKKIGMIVAVEIDAVLEKYGKMLEKIEAKGFEVMRLSLESFEMIIVKSGAGEIAAAAAAQYLITAHDVDMIVNFGVVGGLTDEMSVARLAVVESVVHYDFDVSDWFDSFEPARYLNYPSKFIPTDRALLEAALKAEPSLKPVVCASADKFVGKPEKKRELHESFGADICEMESAGIVLTCDRCGVPCLLIKAVSDSIHGGAEEFEKEIGRCAAICLDTLEKIIKSSSVLNKASV